jgi:hypothetical protein
MDVRGSGFSVGIDRETGAVSLQSGSVKLIGPILNLGELRVDNEDFLDRADPPWIGSKSPPVLTHPEIVGGMIAGNVYRAVVSEDVSLAESPDRVLGRLTNVLRVHGDGEIEWNYQLAWSAADMQAWEFGLKFNITGAAEKFSWYRHGQWTEYPAGHIGANFGSAGPEDRAFSSTKRDTVWGAVGDESSGGISILGAEGPLHTRCRLAGDVTTLFASCAVSVDRDFSSSYCDDTRILFRQGRTYSGSFRLRPFGGGEKSAAMGR